MEEIGGRDRRGCEAYHASRTQVFACNTRCACRRSSSHNINGSAFLRQSFDERENVCHSAQGQPDEAAEIDIAVVESSATPRRSGDGRQSDAKEQRAADKTGGTAMAVHPSQG